MVVIKGCSVVEGSEKKHWWCDFFFSCLDSFRRALTEDEEEELGLVDSTTPLQAEGEGEEEKDRSVVVVVVPYLGVDATFPLLISSAN